MLIRVAQPQDAEAIAKISVDAWRATYAGVIPESYLTELSYEKRQQLWYQRLEEMKLGDANQITLVAENEQQEIIGYICGGESREDALPFDAELYAIYLEPSQKLRGIGSHLMADFIKWLIKKNFQSMFCRVLEKNSSRQFYEKWGGQLLSDKAIARFKNKFLIELAYGWFDLNNLKR